MQIVESSLRPPRMALALSTEASDRVLRRVFRLLGGKWGGYYDIIVVFGPEGSVSRFWADLLVSADPDYVLVVDPHLALSDVEDQVLKLGLQPFEIERLKERQERRSPWRQLFRELPTRPDHTAPKRSILDLDPSRAFWRTIARYGLPHRHTRHRLVKPREDPDTRPDSPIAFGRLGITSQPGRGPVWCLFGDLDDPQLACRYWSLRAIGRAPTWKRPKAIQSKRLRVPGEDAVIYAPEIDPIQVAEAVNRWATSRKTAIAADDHKPQLFPRSRTYLASNTETVAPYEGFWRISLPSAPPLGADYASVARCVTEIHLLSPNPEDPDGIVLAPTETSRSLVSAGQEYPATRITRRGLAQLTSFSKLTLVAIPHISYREAVNAAFSEHDFRLTPSDKGLYQQRSLELAEGLRYLAWLLRQPESRLLIDVFFRYHIEGKKPPPRYRRAVRYDELEELLLDRIREIKGTLRGRWKQRAEDWLCYWVDGLLARGLLLGGHVLRCPVCADRSFYRLESLGQSFECRRCMAASSMPGNTPRSFQLNEAVYQLIEHDGEVATLTLSVLRSSADLSFLYLPEVISQREAVTRELDIAALVDGELVIGEVKSTAHLTRREIKNSRFVAKNSRARKMLFATTAKQQKHCSVGDCAACIAKYGDHHADRAWGPDVRAEIERTRRILEADGASVESLCWHSLQAGYEQQHEPLARFER
jgi:hypothetical protein